MLVNQPVAGSAIDDKRFVESSLDPVIKPALYIFAQRRARATKLFKKTQFERRF